MKLKRLTALLLAAAMAFSTAVTALPAYAEGEGGAASSQSAPDADSTPGGPVGDGEPNSGPSGDPVNGNTPDNTNNDANGDPAGDPNSDPAGDPTGDPGTQQGEECTCTARCTDSARNEDCPICKDDSAQCAYPLVNVEFALTPAPQNGYAECDTDTTLTIKGSVDGARVESVTVSITLTTDELNLLEGKLTDFTISQDSDGNQVLFFTVANTDDGKVNFERTITISAANQDLAKLDISTDDISITYQPDTLDKEDVGLTLEPKEGIQMTLVKKLPTATGDYGSGVAFDTTVDPLTVTYVDSEGNPAAIQQDPPEYKLYFQVEGMDEPRCVQDQVELPFGLENEDIPTVTTTAGDSTWTGKVEDASKLPSQVLVKTAEGDYQAVPVTWTLVPSYAELYEDAKLVQITEDNKGDYPAGLKVDNWYYIAAPEPYPDDTVTVETYLDSLTHTLY